MYTVATNLRNCKVLLNLGGTTLWLLSHCRSFTSQSGIAYMLPCMVLQLAHHQVLCYCSLAKPDSHTKTKSKNLASLNLEQQCQLHKLAIIVYIHHSISFSTSPSISYSCAMIRDTQLTITEITSNIDRPSSLGQRLLIATITTQKFGLA